jgi:hypothetical protein
MPVYKATTDKKTIVDEYVRRRYKGQAATAGNTKDKAPKAPKGLKVPKGLKGEDDDDDEDLDSEFPIL